MSYSGLVSRLSSAPRCGRFLAEVRQRRGLTQRELADRAGMTQANVSRIELDKISPTLLTLERLLGAMGETLLLSSTPLDERPPGGGNRSIASLRADHDALGPGQRIERAGILSQMASELSASRRSE